MREWMLAHLEAFLLNLFLAYLFYDAVWAILLLLPVSFYYLRQWRLDRFLKKELQFRDQFSNAIQLMTSSMRAGHSMENVILETKQELERLYSKKNRILQEFEKMGYELNMNQTAEQVLRSFAGRVDQEDVRDFVNVFAVSKRVGGDGIAILKNTVKVIRQKNEVEQEIATCISSKKLEFRLMCIIPLAMIGYLRITFRDFLSVLYKNPTGVILMTICLGIYVAAWCFGQKLLKIRI